jgi:hypothetical protein
METYKNLEKKIDEEFMNNFYPKWGAECRAQCENIYTQLIEEYKKSPELNEISACLDTITEVLNFIDKSNTNEKKYEIMYPKIVNFFIDFIKKEYKEVKINSEQKINELQQELIYNQELLEKNKKILEETRNNHEIEMKEIKEEALENRIDLEAKIDEKEKMLQNLKTNNDNKIDEMKMKIDELNNVITSYQNQEKELANDKKNKKYVISKFGYDPFDSFGLEDADYRMAFNITAKYLEDESILQDAHKMQSLVAMVMTIIQNNHVETLLTYQYRNIKPDTNEIKALTSTKKDIQATISKIAEDNNISSKYQKENKSAQSHLTAKMKEMANADYWEAKPNKFDVRTSAAMRQMLDISHQSIMSQLELTDSDYAQMVKEQREMIKNLQEERDRLAEELRNMTNKYIATTLVEDKK